VTKVCLPFSPHVRAFCELRVWRSYLKSVGWMGCVIKPRPHWRQFLATIAAGKWDL